MTMISNPVRELLAQLIVEPIGDSPEFVAHELPSVEREVYVEFNEVLSRLRGKWKKAKPRGHRFDYDPRDAIEAVERSGIMPANNPLDYYPTPSELANTLVDLIASNTRSRRRTILEPSAGSGALVHAVMQAWAPDSITMIEVDPLNCAMLEAIEPYVPDYLTSWTDLDISEMFKPPSLTLHAMTFEEFAAQQTDLFDAVIMNPPFGNGLWREHIMLAHELLAEDGAIACIVPAGAWRTSDARRWVEFRRWLMAMGADVLSIEAGAFKASGTMVATNILVIPQRPILTPERSTTGLSLVIDNARELVERLGDFPTRELVAEVCEAAFWESGGGLRVDDDTIDAYMRLCI